MPSPEADQQVVVDALGDPGGQHRVGQRVAPARAGIAEPGDQLGGQVP
jgi:hypothetical protein